MPSNIKLKKKYKKIIGCTLLVFHVTISMANIEAKNITACDRDYINWADCLYNSFDYRHHREPKDIYTYGCKWGNWVTFSNKIAAIDAKVGYWNGPKELFRSQDFLVMYRHPEYYWKHVLDYLSEANHSEKNKKIAIYSLENLTKNCYLSFAESCYALYKKKLLSEELLTMVLNFEFLFVHPIVRGIQCKQEKAFLSRIQSFLIEIQSDLGATSSIGLAIDKILSGSLVEAWNQKYDEDYTAYLNTLPLSQTICDGYKDFLEYVNTWPHMQPKPYKPSYFLIIYDHPICYYMPGIEPNPIYLFLRNPAYTNMEKRLAIFAMQKLEETFYSELIDKVCHCYYWDQVSIHLIEDLIHCSFPNFCKYPFFILDYKVAQYSLNRLIAVPTLPCGLKEMIKSVKEGTLATLEEMKYLEGYKKFCQTHFRLYETILPLKDRLEAVVIGI